MTEERRIADDTALGLIAHLDLTLAQAGFADSPEVGRLCDGFAGGQPRAVAEIQTLRAPVDEYWNLTRGRDNVEARIATMVAALVELEVVDRMIPQLSESAAELLGDATVAWQVVDLGAQAVAEELERDPHRVDGLSLYARRVIGEAAVLLQGVVVRRTGLRVALTGEPDDELRATTAVVDQILSAVAARLSGMGLSV